MMYAIAARVVVWGILIFLALGVFEFVIWAGYVEVKRYFARRKANKELRALYARHESARVDALRSKMQIVDALKTEAVVPSADSVWQERARRAEALGFRDDWDDEQGPWVA